MKRFVLTACVVVVCVYSATAIFVSKRVTATAADKESIQTATPDIQRLHQLTMQVLDFGKEIQAAKTDSDRRALRDQFQTMAASRNHLLTELIKVDPGLAIQVALPEQILASLTPEARTYFEQHVDLDGELEVIYQENETTAQLLHFLKVGDKRLSLHFSGESPRQFLTGDHVHLHGLRVGDDVALATMQDVSTSTSSTVTASPSTTYVAPNTFGEQKVLVLLVNFQDNTSQPWTIDQVRNTVFTSVNNYYLEASYQQTWLSGDVFGWYTLPINATCTESTIGTYANQVATAAGINLSAYKRLVYAYPTVSCGWTGSSTIGGNPSQSWINGSMAVRTVGHELGHGLGLYHSSAWDCGTQVVGTTCSSVEYGDVIDIMGQPGITGHFNAYQKERLGWLGYGASPPVTTVQTNGTYWIDPYESPGANPKALKILKSTDPTTGKNTWYYVEFRRPVGFDSFISNNSNVMNGVMIHMGTDSAGYNYLLDLTPDTTAWTDAALDVGRSYNDANSNVTISVSSVSSTGAAVSTVFGPQPCVPASPSLIESPSASQWVSAGSTLTYQVSLTNNDNGCSAATFNFSDILPAGWSGSFDNSAVTVNAGATVTVNFAVTSPSSALDGYYNIGLVAVNSAVTNYSTSSSVTCALLSSLGVSVATDQPSYARTQTANITTNVTASGSPVSGAAVTFILTKSNGSKVTGSATTDANGSAVFKYRFNKQKDPTGPYQVAVGANLNGIVGSGATSFTVK
jgi:hypothetical protein